MVIAKPFLGFGWRVAEDEGWFIESWANSWAPFHTSDSLWHEPLCQLFLPVPTSLLTEQQGSFFPGEKFYLFLKLLEAKIACFFRRWTQMNSCSLSHSFIPPFAKFLCTFFNKCGLNEHSLWWLRIVTLGKIIWKGSLLKKWRRSGGQFILGP